MPLFSSDQQRYRTRLFLLFIAIFLPVSLLTFAQTTLSYRMLTGYLLSPDATVNKGKPTLFVFEQADTFEQVFKAKTPPPRNQPGRSSGSMPNFNREMVIGIALPPTTKPPRMSVSKVFVQDSTLTIRYVRIADSTTIKNPLPTAVQPTLLLAIPAQMVLSTRLVENGKVMQTIRKRDNK